MTIRIWDVRSGQSIRVLAGHSGQWHSVHLTADGRSVAAPIRNGKIAVWDVGSGRVCSELQVQGVPYHMSMTSDGQVVAVVNEEGQLQIWESTQVYSFF